MDLDKIFIKVAKEHSRYDSAEVILDFIFNAMYTTESRDIDNANCIIFIEYGKLCYRKVFKANNNIVYNDFGFTKPKSEVIPYEGNPDLLKQIVHSFIKKFQSGKFQMMMEEGHEYVGTSSSKDNYTKKENKMKNTIDKMLQVNKDSAVVTAKIELGKSANKLVLTKLKEQLPMMVRGYADSPLAELVIGNVVAGLLIQFAPGNKKAEVLSDSMIAAGVQVAVESFDIPGLVKELLANVDISGIADED